MPLRQSRLRRIVECLLTSNLLIRYSGLGLENLLDLGKAWVTLAGEVLARCFLILSLSISENFFMNFANNFIKADLHHVTAYPSNR